MKIFQYVAMIGFLFCVPTFVFANSQGIAVDQTSIVFDVDTGEVQKFIVEIKNISNEEQKIEIDAMDYIVENDNQITLQKDIDVDTGLRDWIEVQDKNIILAPSEAKEITFTVNTPQEALIGSHHGAVIFRTEPSGDGAVKVQGQIGVHVLINVKGNTHASGYISKFDIPFVASGLVEYTAEFENTGNIHYVPYGDVVVHNIFTKNEQKYEYEKHFVFPGKKFTFSHTEEIPSLFGLYKAHVTFVDGEGATRIKSDYVMGYFFPLIFLLSLASVIFVLWKLFSNRKINKKSVDDTQKETQTKKT